MRLLCLSVIICRALSCSYVEIPVPDADAPNGTKYVIGRTNELGGLGKVRYRIAWHPKGEGDSKLGRLTLEAQLNGPASGLWVEADGMNDAGLTLGAQTLRESKYENPSLLLAHDVLAADLVKELLRNCADVSEALEWLSHHRVVGPGGAVGLHWALADAAGRSVVVEYLNGKRVVWENSGGRVMTNDPPLDWHWRNLNNYVNLNPNYPHQNDMLGVETDVGTVPRPVGHGSNLAGLPGDGSPPSRFVQLFYLRGYALQTAPPKTVDDAIVLASGLLNKVFIPLGTVASDKGLLEKLEGPEYTPFGLVKIPTERKILVRGYRNLRWRQVDLTKLGSENKSWLVEDGTTGVEDITSQGGSGSQDLSV